MSSRMGSLLTASGPLGDSVFQHLAPNNGLALKAIGSIEDMDNVTIGRRNLMQNPPPQFAVGKYNKEYPDYRKVTAAEWKNPTFQAQLVEAHQAGGGWPLLEEPLECNDLLCVAEGVVQIDEEFVAEVGSNDRSTQQLRGAYPAMTAVTEEPWTTRAPTLGNNWTVPWTTKVPTLGNNWTVRHAEYFRRISRRNPPCLFVHKSYNPAPGGGSRRSRKHKRSKRVKKQKRTRKH